MSNAPLPSSFDGDKDFYNENRWQKFTRRLKEEPLIPFGVGLTCWALLSASRSIRKGDSTRTNRMFRYRLYAQSFTLIAMIGGSYYYKADRLKRSEFVKLKKVQEAQEKKDAWIRELEARDLEDKEWRAKMGKVRDLQREEVEMKLVEEKKRMREAEEKEKGKGKENDDGRGVIAAIREKSNQSRRKEGKMQEMEKQIGKTKVEAKKAATPPPEEEEGDGYKTLLGETEAGGLFGLRHIKNMWSSGKPAEDSGREKEPPKEQ